MAKRFDKPFYTVKELSELLDISTTTIYTLIRNGGLTYYKVGNQIRIPADELERLRVDRKK